MKLSSAMLPTVLLAVGLLFGADQTGGASVRDAGCEPGADLDLAARVVEVSHEGSLARVTFQVVLSSRSTLRSYRIFESRHRDLSPQVTRVGTALRREEHSREVGRGDLLDGRTSSVSISSRRLLSRSDSRDGAVAGRLPRSPTYILSHTVVLDRGREHGLVFSAEAEDSAGERRRVEAYVQVNLDPEKQPELLDGLVQFRAEGNP